MKTFFTLKCTNSILGTEYKAGWQRILTDDDEVICINNSEYKIMHKGLLNAELQQNFGLIKSQCAAFEHIELLIDDRIKKAIAELGIKSEKSDKNKNPNERKKHTTKK